MNSGVNNTTKSRFSNSLGLGKFTIIFLALFLSVFGYTAYYVGSFYYYFYEIQNQIASAAKVASIDSNVVLRRKIWYHVKKLGLPVVAKDLRIDRYGNGIRIWLKYTEVFSVPWKGKKHVIHKFHFNAHAEEKLK